MTGSGSFNLIAARNSGIGIGLLVLVVLLGLLISSHDGAGLLRVMT